MGTQYNLASDHPLGHFPGTLGLLRHPCFGCLPKLYEVEEEQMETKVNNPRGRGKEAELRES